MFDRKTTRATLRLYRFEPTQLFEQMLSIGVFKLREDLSDDVRSFSKAPPSH